MAGIGQEAVTPIRPEIATSQIQPINFAVQQNAVAQLADAFRQGVITSDDIIQRYGDRAKTREKAEIQGLDEFLSPAAIAQRKQHAAFLSEKEKSELANLPADEAAKRAVLEQTRIAAEQGDYSAIRKYVIEQGFGGRLSTTNAGESYTDDKRKNDAAVYQDAARFSALRKAAEDTKIERQLQTLSFTDKNGAETKKQEPVLVDTNTGAVYTQEQAAKAARLKKMTPQQWLDAGSPSFDDYVFGPTVTSRSQNQPQQPTVIPSPAPGTAGKTIVTETTTETPEGGKTVTKKTETVNPVITNAVEPVTPAPAEPEVTPRSAAGPTSVFDLPPGVVSFKEAPVDKKVATGEQQRAQLGLDRFEEAAQLTGELKELGYNPAGTWNSATAWLPGPTKPETRQKFELAKKAFSQGLLRLESGAAITVSENKDYATVFFPKWGDTPAVMQAKEQLRNDIAATAAEIATAGGVASPDIKAKADKIRERARAVAPVAGTSTQLGRPTTLSTGKNLVRDPKTGQWFNVTK